MHRPPRRCARLTTKGSADSSDHSSSETGAPGVTRTRDRRIRNPMLYPTELQALSCVTKEFPSGCHPVPATTGPVQSCEDLSRQAKRPAAGLKRVGDNPYRSDTSKVYYASFKRNGKQIRRRRDTAEKELARNRFRDKKWGFNWWNSSRNRLPLGRCGPQPSNARHAS